MYRFRNTMAIRFLLVLPLILACAVSATLPTSTIPTVTPESAKIQPQKTPQQPTATISLVTVSADVLTVRPCPQDDDLKCPPLRYLLRGEVVRWYARTWDGWLRIGKGEYICGEFVK